MVDNDQCGTRHLGKRDLLKVLGASAASLALGQGISSQPDRVEGAIPLWQPNWVREDNWPAGFEGERQRVGLEVGVGQVAALSNNYTKIFIRRVYPVEGPVFQAVADWERIITVVDGGSHGDVIYGGGVYMELNNLHNQKVVADKPIVGRSLTAQELGITVLDRVREAKRDGARVITLIRINLDLPQYPQIIDANRIWDIEAYQKSLESLVSGVPYKLHFPVIGK